MFPLDEAPVALRSVRQLNGRHVRAVTPKALAAMRKAGLNADRWWRSHPEEMVERDQKFFRARDDAHNRWPELSRFTCQAMVRGKRCNRITIVETDHRHCIKHAGPARARLYRENQRKLFECGRLSAAKWFKDEARRTRTAIRDRQRRKKDGWLLPGVTLRLSDPIERRFRADLESLLPHPWSDIPDLFRDQLRWAWRRFMLDRQKHAAWDAKARAILSKLGTKGQCDGADQTHATGFEPHVLLVERRCTAFSWRSRQSVAEAAGALRASSETHGTIRGHHRDHETSDQGGGSAIAVRQQRRDHRPSVDLDAIDELLLRHGRDLSKRLRDLPETAWPALLRAYDAYTRDPTAANHRAFMSARSTKSGATSILPPSR
jgi:hypothetical protein